jgi:hypothetical protein
MAGNSWEITPITRLKCMASSCFFGEPTYYNPKVASYGHFYEGSFLGQTMFGKEWHGLNPAQKLEKAIDEALDYDAEATLDYAFELRTQLNIRATPQVIAVRAANMVSLKGQGIRQYALATIQRPDDAATQFAYHVAKYGKNAPIPNALKKAWREYLIKCTEYDLAKYQLASKEVKMVDLINMVRPKSEAIDKFMKGTLSNTGKTWEAIISGGGRWDEAVEVMGHMALLRNLRNFVEKSDETTQRKVADKLVATAAKGHQLPFRYWSAFNALVEGGRRAPGFMLDAVENALRVSLGNLPRLQGNSLVLSDNSGSARHAFQSKMGSVQISTIGNLLAAIVGKISDNARIGVFGDRLSCVESRKSSSVFDDLKTLNNLGEGVGQGTENGIWLALHQAIAEREHWDNIFVCSDMQAGHGGLYGCGVIPSEYLWRTNNQGYGAASSPVTIDVPYMLHKYRKINPNVNVFLIQTAGYEDTIIPEYFDRTYVIGGWSDGVIHFADQMIKLRQ